MNEKTRRAIVIGGSLGGLLAGLQLQLRGWDVGVYERSPTPLTGRGAGLVTHPELREALKAMGLDADTNFGVPILGRAALDTQGHVIARHDYPQITTSWNRMFEMLKGALAPGAYHPGKDLQTTSQNGDGVTAHFADGSSAWGDILVGADGFRSIVRAQHAAGAQPGYAGYVAWRGLLDERKAMPILGPDLFNRMSFFLPPGEEFLGYPVAGPGNDLREGHRSWNLVWYRPADEKTTLPWLLTDDTGKRHEISIPPPLIARGVVAGLRADAERLLPDTFKAIIRAMEAPFLQPIYDLESARMVFGRTALLGDAAFVVRPHVGAGVAKAADDAAELAKVLDEHADVADALQAYEARRLGIGRKFVERARRLGCFLKHEFANEEERTAAAFHAEPQRVIAEAGRVDFLRV